MRIDPAVLQHHPRTAFCFSGGKDSTAVWHLLHDAGLLDRVTTYHMDTGDLLPEMRTVVAHYEALTPNFVRVQGDVNFWIMQHGLPTDLLPHSAHWVGAQMGEGAGTPLVSRYDCCFNNLMLPMFQRIMADGNTLVVRGTKAADMQRLPCGTGDTRDGIEMYYPLQDASHDDVFRYLASVGAKLCPVYEHVTNSPECATCSAWWGEQRASYLKHRHPALFRRYKARMTLVLAELRRPLATLAKEMGDLVEPPALPIDIMEHATGMLTQQGIRVFQANRLGMTDIEHVHALMKYMPLPQDATVLDAGCGVGEVAWIIGSERRDLRFILLNKSARQLNEAPGGPRYQRVLGDFHAMPLGDASIDVAMFGYSLCYADHVVALREAARVTKPGGALFVYDYERLGGDNKLMEQTLFARAVTHKQLCGMAGDAGWGLEAVAHPPGDDMFRMLFNDPAAHAAIFDELRPTVWQFRRESSHGI